MTDRIQIHPPAPLAALLSQPHVEQRAFPWPQDRWIRWFDGHDTIQEVLRDLDDRFDRRRGVELVQRLLEQNDAASAFVVSMVWGHGDSGYGPYRTAAILTANRKPRGKSLDPGVIDKLEESARLVREEGGISAFKYLSNEGKVGGLGSAFFTKWLYFASSPSGVNSSSAVPVLDQLVLAWLKSAAEVRLRPGRTKDYGLYIELLEGWGYPFDRKAVQVEETIFRLIRDDGVDSLSR